ncbi:uncharacterized protein LOC142323061 isoform X1 [Lycorma delicatula]|uniref:uncharacterized protein LOC142323061 isoform X1 n=1 Tax=Lycorma delicatula TaxID=130591 RepID=UPI003F5123B7
MDYEDESNVQPGPDGLYAVLCFNRSGFPESKIKEDFKKFGEIVNFRQLESGGLCFIRYRERNEFINCLKEMSKTPYQARIPNSKKSSDKGNNFKNDKHTNHKKDNKQNNKNVNNYEERVGSNRYYLSNGSDKPHSNMCNSQLISSSHNVGSTDDELPPPLVDINEFNVVSNNVSKLKSPPPLTSYSSLIWKNELGQLPHVEATEVIIANLPAGLYQRDLYKLCSKGEPLHVEMKNISSTVEICYACVYLKSMKDAQILINELNGQFIKHHRLVVALAGIIVDEYRVYKIMEDRNNM